MKRLGDYFNSLRSLPLFILLVVLLGVNVVVTDPLPFVDELILLMLSILVGRWKKPISPEDAHVAGCYRF